MRKILRECLKVEPIQGKKIILSHDFVNILKPENERSKWKRRAAIEDNHEKKNA